MFAKRSEQSGAKHVPYVPNVSNTNIVPGQHRPLIPSLLDAGASAFTAINTVDTIVPKVEVVQTLGGGRSSALAGNRRLARVWRLVFNVLDELGTNAVDRVCWMPAHRSSGAVGRVLWYMIGCQAIMNVSPGLCSGPEAT